MADIGIKTTCLMKTDSTAAKGMANRRGHCKVKHLQTCEPWLQEVVKDKGVDVQKVGMKDNPLDLKTNRLDGKTAAGLTKTLSARTATGWHELAPRLKIKQCL